MEKRDEVIARAIALCIAAFCFLDEASITEKQIKETAESILNDPKGRAVVETGIDFIRHFEKETEGAEKSGSKAD